ncbi:TIGR03085 family protein [Friedmanniella luteola]|uniref:TIGR03085 family protein n=1 Tax=Friedmanniella luteola TaxID=546871 RepID=A0A1H1YNP0_9ACTN|nr:TIGR03085 family metal-binding protein [Friedmanniella luteola]SDT22970.1 TIGR03085 family protein [Friedmanniella luteola]
MGWARTEKKALVDTLRRTDPDAPTLCEGWDAKRLLAHLVQREQDPVGGIGDVVGRAEPGREKHLGRLAEPAATPDGYAGLIDRFVTGPPRWSPMSWASEQVNVLEYAIHHEDVRRGGGAGAARTLPAAQSDAIFRQVPLTARMKLRRSPVGVVLARPGGAPAVVRSGSPSVTLTGEPLELALWVSGRRQAAQVQLSGPPEAVERFEGWLGRS